MKTLYLDLFSGISGDMFLGAVLDLGLKLELLEQELRKLQLDGYHLHAARQTKGGIAGTKLDVHVESDHDQDTPDTDALPPLHDHAHVHPHAGAHGFPHLHAHTYAPHKHQAQPHGHAAHGRNYADIRQLILDSSLSEWVKQKAVAVFHRVALAEGKIHGQPPEAVHFHEVGAIDSIVDIVGACIALELLGKPRVLASDVVEGTGSVRCAHGRLPLPAPATLEILTARGIAIRQCEEPNELVTPTGAALAAEFAERFGPLVGLVPTRIGYGLGTRENKTRPNVLRAVLCETENTENDWEIDRIAVLQTNLDDINAEILGSVMRRAFEAGALDLFHTPIQMKKDRPGVLLTILCAEADADKFSELLLRHTTAFGVRRQIAERRKLKREFQTVETQYGPVAVKIGKLNGEILQAAPEYESCRKLADETGLPVKQVFEAAVRAVRL